MTLKITLHATGNRGVNFKAAYDTFFDGFAPSGMPEFLGPNESETTQIVHLATPEAGKEAEARAVLLDGRDFAYTFSNHTVSGRIDKIQLATLGDAYDAGTGQLVLENGVVRDATPSITISSVGVSNPAGETGPVHNIVAGLMGGGPSGGNADASALSDVIWGEGHSVFGSARADTYTGTRYDDVIRGLGGNDALAGRAGDDVITGGAGADRMSGGAGRDTFVFAKISEIRGDVIRDFDGREGDRIRLTSIDANEDRRGNQAFDFIGDDRFSGTAGELRAKAGAERTLVSGDTDGDGRGDFVLVLSGRVTLDEDHFLL